jgi:hypothetical protein
MAPSAPELLLDDIPEEDERRNGSGESFARLLQRLSRQSVAKHFDAYADIDWDAEALRIDPADPRWELSSDDGLGATSWYRDEPPAVRSRIGLHRIAAAMKIGAQFENVLQRGLLEFALTLPNGAPEFRYAYHELIEEGQHSLMFQEFVNRSGLDVPGLPPLLRFASREVVRFARRFPCLFFLFVLGGEDPIDHLQRRTLGSGRPVHPLLRRIMQIHVTEEARHLCFARHYLRQHVPRLGPVRRRVLSVRAPILLGVMAQLMLRPPRQIIRTYGIPPAVVAEAYTHNPAHRELTIASVRKVHDLCRELGIITPRTARLWRRMGIAPA